MTAFPDGIVIEARKAGLKQAKRKAADGSWFDVHDITFEIHPNDTNSPLSNMPLGTRVALVVTQLREDGAEKPPQTQTAPETVEDAPRLKGGARAKQAGILCSSHRFQDWLSIEKRRLWQEFACEPSATNEDLAAAVVRASCNVVSRAELDHIKGPALVWDQIDADYRASQPGQTETDRVTQLESGPS